MLDKLRSNPKALYSYIKSKQKIRPSIGPLQKSDGSLTADDQEVAETLNLFFESTFTREDLSSMPVPSSESESSICDIDITKSIVLQKLRELNVNIAPGPDGLHSYVLKTCANTLSTPLTILYSQSLSVSWRHLVFMVIYHRGYQTFSPTVSRELC